MLIGTLGYRVRGDPTGVEIEDTWHASIGGLLRGLSDTSFDWGAGVSVGHDF